MIRCRFCLGVIVWVEQRYWGSAGSHAGQCSMAPRLASSQGNPHRPLLPDPLDSMAVRRWLDGRLL